MDTDMYTQKARFRNHLHESNHKKKNPRSNMQYFGLCSSDWIRELLSANMPPPLPGSALVD